MPGRRPRACVHLIALGLLAAACSGPAAASPPRAAAGPAAAATPAGVSDSSCGDPTTSLPPDASLPAPGSMPAGSFVRLAQDRGRFVAGVSGDRLLFGALDPLTNELKG